MGSSSFPVRSADAMAAAEGWRSAVTAVTAAAGCVEVTGIAPQVRSASGCSIAVCPPTTIGGRCSRAEPRGQDVDRLFDGRQVRRKFCREEDHRRSVELNGFEQEAGRDVGAEIMHRPPLGAEQSADHAQPKFMALTLDAGRDERRPVAGGTGVPEGEIGDQVARELRDFFFLGHEELAMLPALPEFGQRRLEHLAEEPCQWQTDVIGRNDRLVCRGEISAECLPQERFGQRGRRRQAVQVHESLPNLVERQPLRLPRLDLPDALDVSWGIEPVAATGPDRRDQALPFQEAQAGVGDVRIGVMHPGDDGADRDAALPGSSGFPAVSGNM